MANVANHSVGYTEIGAWFQRIAAELGQTPLAFFMQSGKYLGFNPITQVKGFSIEDGLLTAQLRGDVTLTAHFVPQTLTVTRIVYSHNGKTAFEWAGQMTAEQFLTDDWPPTTYYGSGQADIIEAFGGDLIYGGAGQDLLVLSGGSAKVYGQADTDTFIIDGFGELSIGDYQPGEKIMFEGYESLAELAADFKGVQTTGNGFRLLFKGAYTPQWSLSFENLSMEQLRLEDLAFGTDATRVGVYQQVFAAFGLDITALLS